MIEFKTASDTIEVNGDNVKIESTLFLGREGISLALQIGKLIAPFFRALGFLSSKNDYLDEKDSASKIELSPDFFKTIVEQLITAMDDKKILELIFRLLRGTRINGQEVSKPEIFDIVFQANLSLLYKVLEFIIVKNFSGFFDSGSVSNLLKKMASNALQK